jgi:NADH-quinone oxidoreductase subunit N
MIVPIYAKVSSYNFFHAKLLILQQVISSGMITVAIIAVVFAVISAYYYFKLLNPCILKTVIKK